MPTPSAEAQVRLLELQAQREQIQSQLKILQEECEQRDKELQMQLKMQQEELQTQIQMQQEHLQAQREQREQELQTQIQMQQEQLEVQQKRADREESMLAKTKRYGQAVQYALTKMPLEAGELPPWFDLVENIYKTYDVPDELKATLILPYLTPRSKSLISRLPVADQESYVILYIQS